MKKRKLFELIADGILSIADSSTSRRPYTYPVPDGFARDQENLRGDVNRVGDDMRHTITKYGKQSNQSAGGR